MKLKGLIAKLTSNPWLNIITALYIMGTSVYDILDDITILRKEHFVFSIGLFMLLKSIFELLEKLKAASDKLIRESKKL